MSLARQPFGESQPASLFRRAGSDIKSNPVLYVLSIVLLAAVYFAAAKFGLSLASVHTNVSPVWPPTGIALAAILILGYRVWPGIFLGALLTNLLTPIPMVTAFGIAIGNTLETVIAARVLMAIGFRPAMDRARDVFKFVVVAAVCTTISATIGNLSLYLGGASSLANFGSLWVTWWLGDLTGAVTVAPLILTWSLGTGNWLPKHRYLEAALLILLLSISAIVTFGEKARTVHFYPLTLLMIPFLLWAAFRLGRRGVTVAVAVISAFAIWGTSHELGPFVTSDPNQSLMMLQLFIAFNAVTSLFLVTVVEEKRLAETRRAEDQRRLEANLAVTQILAESPKVGIALERILPTVGESLGWEFGCVWFPASDRTVLRSIATWQKTPKPQFDAVCCERTFEPGVGLPGRVWAKREPAWICDVAHDDNFPRMPIAIAEGLHGAFAFPITFKENFFGVIEFFSSEIRQPDEHMLAMFAGIGSQIGQFIERKGAAEALRDNESRLRLATTTGNVGVWDWDIENNRVSWTDSLYEIHGITKEDFPGTGEAFSNLIHPDDRERVSKAIEESLHHDVPYQLELRTVRPNGEIVWLFTNATVIRENGMPVRMLGGTVDISDIKRAEQALRESEQRYRAVIEALPAAVYTTDAAGRVTMFNQAAVDFSGRMPEVGGDSWCVTWKLYHPDGKPMPHAECPMAMALKSGEIIRGHEAIAERPDGTRVNFIPYPTPLHDADGNLIGAINMLVDITDRKKAEETLQRSERELTEFFENATEAIHWVGPDGTILRANKAELRMLGYSAEEYVGRNIAEFHVDLNLIHDILRRLHAGETLENCRAQMRCKDGSIRDVLINSSVYFENGEFVHTRCFTRDITEQLRAEKALRHLAAIVETTDDAVISKDLNGIITSWNPAAERLYGYKTEEVAGKPIAILIPPEWPDEEHKILARLRRGERIDHYETVRVAKDGRRVDVSLTVSPIHDATGKIIGASKIARDITEQKRTQEEIARLLAAERAARQDAQVASRTKDEFIATLSHELRTPLTAMLGWLTILRGHKLDKKTTEHAIETIERNAKAQAQLIEDLVDISRIVGGKLNLEVMPTELMPVVDAAIEVVRPAADAKEIAIEVNYDATVGPVAGDASRLQQIIWNLLSNAVKFTPKGGRVSIDFRGQNGFAEVVVSDTGIGISADFLPHVFERFRQAESTATRSHRGMGLGLAIVRHLIELHGGTVTAASNGENRGSTFTIQLPLAPVEKRRVTHVSQKTNSDNGHELKGLRILLVEDEPDARELIAMVLQSSGAQVEAVHTAQDAFESLSLFAPDVLVSDIGLPLESGYDLIRKVRAMASDTKKVPAIALTAFATENDRKLSLSAGFQAHLAKPVEPGDLLKAIMGVINGKHHSGQ
ncbi:MAG: PAS domain S-box protein [Acidobacteriota bacterium]